MAFYNSIKGQRLGQGEAGQLVTRMSSVGDLDISQPCVNATITVSAEGASTANTRDITIQLLDARGNDINYVETVEIIMFLTADRLAFVTTGGSTGIDVGADGALLDIVAKKVFLATSEANGDIDLEWLDTGSEAAFLGLRLPNGRYVMSGALANAT